MYVALHFMHILSSEDNALKSSKREKYLRYCLLILKFSGFYSKGRKLWEDRIDIFTLSMGTDRHLQTV